MGTLSQRERRFSMSGFDLTVNESLVAGLLVDQFPEWCHLPLKRIKSAGTGNAIYRLGDQKAVRLPLVSWAADFIKKEVLWLPKLAPHLPLATPVPIAMGNPGRGYPSHWSVVNWLAGENAFLHGLSDTDQAATRLGEFVSTLQRLDTADGPLSGEQNVNRGVPLVVRDAMTREAITTLRGVFDIDELAAAWESALKIPQWSGPPAWLHGDLHSGNLLATDGQLTAVIDFGLMGVGDPACDVMVAWWLFSGRSRETFRSTIDVDDHTWDRGRGWALTVGVVAHAHYLKTNAMLAELSFKAIEESLADRP